MPDDVRWTPEQERWRGSVEAKLEGYDKRLSDISRSREDQGRDVSARFAELNVKVTEMDKDYDLKFDQVHTRIGETEKKIIEAVNKVSAKVGTMWVIGAGAFVLLSGLVIAAFAWLLKG